MTSFLIDTSVSVNQFLGAGEAGVVTSTGTIAFFDFEPAIEMIDAASLTVNGSVIAGTTEAINSVSSASSTITIGSTGLVSGTNAIDITAATDARLSNAGTISASFTAVETSLASLDFDANLYLTNTGTITSLEFRAIDATIGYGRANISNSGTISGRTDAILISATSDSQGVTITNSGTIEATAVDGEAIALLGGTLTTIRNSGSILGDISTFDVALDLTNTGTITGNVTGHDQKDTFNLIGGTVSGTVAGGLGDDIYYIDSTALRITEATNQGSDTVYSTVTTTLVRNFDNLFLTGSAAIDATGNALSNQLGGNDADNILRGRGGNDFLDGGEGEDTLIGGIGNDAYRYDADDTIVENALGGTDTILLTQVTTPLTVTMGANIENLSGGLGFNMTITGNASNNYIFTSTGNDTLNGLTGTDTLEGGSGNDTYITDGGDVITDSFGFDTVQSSANHTLDFDLERLFLTGTAVNGTGNGIANTITGNGSANNLNGLLGSDTLTGAGGADNFIFTTALGVSNIDRITDFNAAADTIRIDNAVFTGLAAGALAATAFVQNITGKAADASDRIIYDTKTGALLFDADGTGAQTAVQFATIAPGLVLTSADFFVI